jgi:C1A family cysteine protease
MTDTEGKPWEKLNHSVVLLGWGEDENANKFWHLRNSYGNEWGENGDFMAKRGTNDMGLEEENIAFEPEWA